MKSIASTILLSFFFIGIIYQPLQPRRFHQKKQPLATKQIAYSFAPPYSDTSYSCRCLAKNKSQREILDTHHIFEYHRAVCEYKSYIAALRQPVNYLFDLLTVNQESLTDWFMSQCISLKNDIIETMNYYLKSDDKGLAHNEKELLTTLCKQLTEEVSLYQGQIVQTRSGVTYQEFEAALLSVNLPRKKTNKLLSLFEQAQWFFTSSQSIDEKQIKQELIPLLPLELLIDTVSTPFLKKSLQHLRDHHDSSLLIQSWDFLQQFDPEEEGQRSSEALTALMDGYHHEMGSLSMYSRSERSIALAFIALKEFSSIISMFHHQLCITTLDCLDISNEQPKSIVAVVGIVHDVMAVYNIVRALPINDTVNALNKLLDSFHTTLDRLKSYNEKASTDWFKNMWVKIPVGIGVIIVKVFEHYCGLEDAAKPSGSSLFSSGQHSSSILQPVGGLSHFLPPSMFASATNTPQGEKEKEKEKAKDQQNSEREF